MSVTLTNRRDKTTVVSCMLKVLPLCDPFEIVEVIIATIAIFMVTHIIGEARSNKCFNDKAMNCGHPSSFRTTEMYHAIVSLVIHLLREEKALESSRMSRSIDSDTI